MPVTQRLGKSSKPFKSSMLLKRRLRFHSCRPHAILETPSVVQCVQPALAAEHVESVAVAHAVATHVTGDTPLHNLDIDDVRQFVCEETEASTVQPRIAERLRADNLISRREHRTSWFENKEQRERERVREKKNKRDKPRKQ